MLLVSESNAFGCWEQCSWRLKAMQSDKSQFLVLSPLQSESGIAERLVSRAAELRVKCCARVKSQRLE